MRVLEQNLDLINLRNQLIEDKRQKKLIKQQATFKQKKKNLVELSKQPITKQVAKYKTLEKLINEFKKYQITNDKIDQIKGIEKLNDEIITYKNNIESKEYIVTPDDFSDNKRNQYKFRLNNIKKINYQKDADYFWDRLNTRLYTAAEWIAEDWSLKNGMPYYDYNQSDQMAPQDCRINEIDVDVKTTLQVGCKRLKNYYSRKGTLYENEIILGITSWSAKRDIIDTSEDFSEHLIHGIFDPNAYSAINLKLNYLPISTKLLNACYFQPLVSYFKLDLKLNNISSKYDVDILDYLLNKRLSLPAIYVLISRYFPTKLKSYLISILPNTHHDLIEVIIELQTKNSIALLPHYLADYIMKCIQEKREIDSQAIDLLIDSISIFQIDQKRYINNLLKLSKALPKVRCKFHKEETIKEMDIVEGAREQGPTSTFYAQCSKNPINRTTIFTNSWKTGETVIYGDKDILVCDSIDCGCLTHPDRRVYKVTGLRFGRYECDKYGYKAEKKLNI
jgi:hypothetical protein